MQHKIARWWRVSRTATMQLLLCTALFQYATGVTRDKMLSGVGITSLFSALPNTEPDTNRQFDAEVHPWVEQIAESPRVYLFHNFLSEEERKHLIKLAAPSMRRSKILVDDGPATSAARTSYGTFLRRLQDPVVERIQRRVELWSQTPMAHQEDMQILRYAPGQQYATHYDTVYDQNDKTREYMRLATFLMYLSDVEAGGETAFPSQFAHWLDPHIPNTYGAEPSLCAKGRVYTRAKAGDAVLFYSYFPNRTMDLASQHTGCPVVRGVKWSAPIWLHADPFRPEELRQRPSSLEVQHDPGLCQDYSPDCQKWKDAGDCESSKDFMLGGEYGTGQCRAACGACKPCAHADWECRNANREAAGFLPLVHEEMEALGVGDFFEAHSH